MKLRRYLTLSAATAGFLTLPSWAEEDHDHDHDHSELEAGHVDVEVAFEDGALKLHLHDEGSDMELEPDETILAVPEEAEATVPDNANFAFLGNVGDPLWILPQNAKADVLFLGVSGEIETGALQDDTAFLELVSVEGPGNFFVYDTDAFGSPNVMISSADGITSDDRLTVSAGAHFHVDWTFTAEGDYDVTFIIKGTLADGTPIESAPTTLAFEVGHHDDDGHGHDDDHDHDHGELEAGHADVEVAYEDGELELHIHDEDTDTELEPGEVVLAVPEEAESTVPDNAAFAFLGTAGDPLWILPQVAQSDVLFLGISGGEVASGALMDDTAYVELVSVDGPGSFFVYETDSFGAPNVMINSADGITGDDRLTVLAGSHAHVNWTFDAEGDYDVTFVIKAALADGTPIESEPTTLAFEVGHHDEGDGHGHEHGDGKTELANGHADVEVAFEDGELELHIHDEDTDMELEPSEVVLGVPEDVESSVPDNADFAFLGNVGDPLWILPQNAQANVLFLGVAADELESGALMDDVADVELVSVDGPGNFFVYDTDAFGVPNVMINSADGITSDDRLTVTAGAHFHVDWAFTAEGDYGITFVVKGTLPDGTPIESEATTLCFEVGHHDEAGLAFTFETFEIPNATGTTISDIQNDGTLVGRYLDDAGLSQGFIQNDNLTTFNITGITSTFPGGMNSAGQVVGFYRDADDPEIQYGFVREPDGSYTTIEPEGQTFTYAWRINESGQVNGYWFESDPFFIRSFQRANNGDIQDFVFDGSPTGTVTRGLNDAGVQAGWKWTDDFHLQGITWEAGAFSEPFVVDGWAHTLPGDINNNGEIAGTVNDDSFTRNAGFFRDADGEITVFNPPGASSVEVFGLNDKGYVVGEYADASGTARGFIAHPAALLAEGHADIGLAYEDGELELHIHDEEADIEYAPSAIVIRLNEDAERAIPDTPNFSFLGDPDYSVWVLPQSFDEHLPFLGLAAAEVPEGIFVDDLVTLELVSVDASGDFFAYTTDGFGNISVMMDSANGIQSEQDRIPAAVGSHQHLNWAFNAPGTYRIGVRVLGTLQTGGEVSSESMFVTFTVPEALRTQPAPDPDGDIVRVRQGEVDLGVAFEDGAFDLHLHDHAADIEYEADEARVFASDVARSLVPDDANFSFLGAPDQTVWILPQRENPTLPYLGVAGEEIEQGVFQDDQIDLAFIGLTGPGDMSMYVVDGFGVPIVYFNSGDDLTESDRYEVGVGSHAHVNWAFTAPGVYEVTLQASGTLVDGSAVQSEPTTFGFEVEPGLVDAPFDQWILDNFGADPSDEAGVNGNRDMDDLNNVLEFAFGTDPNVADSTELEVIDGQTLTTGTPVLSLLTVGDDVNFTVRFVHRVDAEMAGLTYEVQFSRDMAEWESSDQAPIVVATQGDYEVVEVDFPFALSNGRKPQFFRVLAELSN